MCYSSHSDTSSWLFGLNHEDSGFLSMCLFIYITHIALPLNVRSHYSQNSKFLLQIQTFFFLNPSKFPLFCLENVLFSYVPNIKQLGKTNLFVGKSHLTRTVRQKSCEFKDATCQNLLITLHSSHCWWFAETLDVFASIQTLSGWLDLKAPTTNSSFWTQTPNRAWCSLLWALSSVPQHIWPWQIKEEEPLPST